MDLVPLDSVAFFGYLRRHPIMTSFTKRFRLTPKSVAQPVSVELPGSKSYTNRALLLAALCRGESMLSNCLFSDDTARMMECLNALGVLVESNSETREIRIESEGRPSRVPPEPLFCGNAGTAIRFLVPFCALGPATVTLTGNERMRERPIRDLLEGLQQLGVDAVDVEGTGCPPVRVPGGGIAGGTCRIQGANSSQYVSALLMASARMERGLRLVVEGDLVSKPYIDMTRSIMERFGIDSQNDDYRTLSVPGNQEPSAVSYRVEGDASGASYFFAAAAITGGTVRVGYLPEDTCQGDRDFVRILERMGCTWRQDGDEIELTGGPLRGIEADLNAMSDTAQTLAVTALFAEGPTTIRNIANVRIKETDRIAALATELTKLGARVEEYPDGLTIHPAAQYQPAEIHTYDDHRMAMSFALAGLKIPGVVISEPGCVTKTFPDFFEKFSPWVEVEPCD